MDEACFDPACARRCSGYDVRIEATTVVQTSITTAGGRRAEASLGVALAAPRAKEPA